MSRKLVVYYTAPAREEEIEIDLLDIELNIKEQDVRTQLSLTANILNNISLGEVNSLPELHKKMIRDFYIKFANNIDV